MGVYDGEGGTLEDIAVGLVVSPIPANNTLHDLFMTIMNMALPHPLENLRAEDIIAKYSATHEYADYNSLYNLLEALVENYNKECAGLANARQLSLNLEAEAHYGPIENFASEPE